MVLMWHVILRLFSKKTECLLSASEFGKYFLDHRFGREVDLLPVFVLILFWYPAFSNVLVTRQGKLFAGSGSHLVYHFNPACICVVIKMDDPSFLSISMFVLSTSTDIHKTAKRIRW